MVLRLIDGDEEAFCELYAAYKNRLLYFALKFVKSHEFAEDIFQDAFTVVWQTRRFINPEASFSSYLYTIVRNRILNQLRDMANEDQLKEQIRFMQLQSNDSRQLELPAELDGYAITTKKSIPLPFIVFLLCVSIGVLLVCKGYSDLLKAGQKRNQELMQAYTSFVDLLSLYMGAGLTVKGALLKIVTMTDSRILSEEINYTLNEIRSGIPETEGYYRLGNRLELPVYLKMMTLLSQNIRKGTRDILNMLAEEELSALQLKRELAKKKGEEAGTRLLFPMILQLGVVMIIVIAPALMGF